MAEQKERGIDFCRPYFDDHAEVINAKNPLVVTEPIVGNDIRYDENNSIKILTGPNNGGKTVYAKTVGLVHALAQRGFYVPASSAKVKFVSDIYTHFVSPDDIKNAEGRYKNEMRRMNDVFDNIKPDGLVILDEPCGGTTLEAGEAVTRDFLLGFNLLGNITYLTTHMSGVADAINDGDIELGENLHLEMKPSGEPTFHLKDGKSPMDYGSFIPKTMGLDYNALQQRLQDRASNEGFKLTNAR